MDLGHKVEELIQPHILCRVSLFGIEIPISHDLVVLWICMAIIVLLTYIFVRNLRTSKPGKIQNVVELFVEFINNFEEQYVGHAWKFVAPVLGSLLLLIGFTNIVGLINIIPGFAMEAPTKNLGITGGFALFAILFVILSTLKFKGIKGFAKELIDPMPIVLPFKLLEYIIRPMSLALRLFGNVLGSVIIMQLIYFAIPLVLPSFASMYFDIFDGFLQAFVFVFLTTLYISENVEEV